MAAEAPPPVIEKIVLVTRQTRLEGLVEKFNTVGQARFYIEHAGGDFSDYQREHDVYRAAVARLDRDLRFGPPVHVIDRGFLPNYLFSGRDLVVTVGGNGLVANTAKYVGRQPIIGVNPEPERFEGVLLAFSVDTTLPAVHAVFAGRATTRDVTLAEAHLADGQRLLAFNDLFIGQRSHQSARYELRLPAASEVQSSSGIIVSTGAGSTGWLSSCFNMASGVATFSGGTPGTPETMAWDDPRLLFVVREPFRSRQSTAAIVAGEVGAGLSLVIESRMPSGGVIFSDGIETDFLTFDSGALATIRAADQRARLVAA